MGDRQSFISKNVKYYPDFPEWKNKFTWFENYPSFKTFRLEWNKRKKKKNLSGLFELINVEVVS